MHHLTLEDLARLVDEAPTLDERAHLDCCERCLAELDSITVQTGMLGQLPDPVLPQPLQWRIKAALITDTLVPPIGNRDQWWMRAAAGFALFVVGAAAGTFWIAPRLGTVTEPPAVEVAPSTQDEASSLAAAEAAYLRALTDFARNNYSNEGLDPINRLAALEGIVLTTGAALREAPADPVINNYHMTALGHRDALLRLLEEVSDTLEWF